MWVERVLLKGGCVLTLDPDIGNYVVKQSGFALPEIES